MDLLITIVREFLLANSMETKVVLMSATFDPAPFVNYFRFSIDKAILEPAVVVLESQRSFKIQSYYLDTLDLPDVCFNSSKPEISTELYETAKKIIRKRLEISNKNILVFLPGLYEIVTLRGLLCSDPEVQGKSLVCVLHSSLATRDQRVAFQPADKPKIVLSTNIAESSVTIDSVDCVVDFCLTKYIQRDKSSKASIASLKLAWASKNSLDQRAGRTGRTCDGVVFRMIYRHFHESLPKSTTPEMQRCPLETVVLRVKMLEEKPQFLFKAMSPPNVKDVKEAVCILKELGALERISLEDGYIQTDGKLTYVGRVMAALPLDPRVAKLIILGYMYSVLSETITIAAGLTNKSIFSFRFQDKFEIYTKKLKWANGSGCDLIAILNAYNLWMLKVQQRHFEDDRAEINWCNRNNLERKSLHEMRTLIREVQGRLTDLKMDPVIGVSWEDMEKPLILKICAAGAFMPNYFSIGNPSEDFEEDIYGRTVGRDPSRTVFLQFKGQDVAYNKLGVVYEGQIKERLVSMGICSAKRDVNVIFEKGSSKIFIQFSDDTIDDDNYDVERSELDGDSARIAVAGKIKPEVYKAVKWRQLGERFCLQVMDQDESYRWGKEKGLDVDERDVFGPAVGIMSHPELCVIPTHCTASLIGKVTHIVHCSKFYIQPTSPADDKLLKTIQDSMQDLFEIDELIPFEAVSQVKRFQFLAVYDDEIWKRAKAVGVSSDTQMISCLLFDYGETKKIPIALVFRLIDGCQTEVFKLPERCFEASLSEITPSFVKCPRGKWTTKAREFFSERVLDRNVSVKVYSVCEEIASVELWDGDSCINKELISAEFASEIEENFTRKHNHELRKSLQSGPKSHHFGAAKEFTNRRDTLVARDVQSPPYDRCRIKLCLNGPTSPLETSPISLMINSDSSDTVDPTSVNSVLLYEDPANACGRLLVAANATQSQRSVVLHETTAMPDILGLPVLLALIFAPDAIIKRNKELTGYECIQFGLGCDPDTRIPYFPKHDCILPVTINLDDEDFHDFNNLRFLMSYSVMTQPTEHLPSLEDETKLDVMQNIKNLILKILDKKHFPIPSQAYGAAKNGRWMIEDQSDNVKYYYEEILHGGGLYHLWQRPPLYDLNEAAKQVMKVKLRDTKQQVT